MQRVQPEAVTALETLGAFRNYLLSVRRRSTDTAQLDAIFTLINRFEYEIKQAEQAEDPRQLRLFD
jgi:hypothetical protein